MGLRNRVRDLHAALRVATADSARLALHAQLETTWGEVLRSGTALDPAWEELKGTIGWAEAGTGPELLRVVTWNVELSDRTQRYGGFVLRGDEPQRPRPAPIVNQARQQVATTRRIDVNRALHDRRHISGPRTGHVDPRRVH